MAFPVARLREYISILNEISIECIKDFDEVASDKIYEAKTMLRKAIVFLEDLKAVESIYGLTEYVRKTIVKEYISWL